MLSGLREKNHQLKDKLRELRLDSERLFGETECHLRAGVSMESSFGAPRPPSSRKRYSYDNTASVTPSGRYQLSDRAKNIRGEASKRIDGLLSEWRDYKERTEEETRRRYRSEQHLRELLTRKEQEVDQLTYDIDSLRSLTHDQKKEIDQLTEERDNEAKCRTRCVDLEMQIAKMNRYISEVHNEMKTSDEAIRSSESERESLLLLNSQLREENAEQKKKIYDCEQDVSETQMELEILEEMVRALNDRKSHIFGASRSTTPNPNFTSEDRSTSSRLYSTPKKVGGRVIPPDLDISRIHAKEQVSPIPIKFADTSSVRESPSTQARQSHGAAKVTTKSSSEGSSGGSENRKVSDRRSAMSALKSLQKEHAEKCSFLAEHIQKLKEENKAKEKRITELQSKNQKSPNIANQ